MTEKEELELILKLIKKYNLPLSPILEYQIREMEKQYEIKDYNVNVISESEPVFEVYKELDDYLNDFANLSVATIKGKKLPHKAILLLAIINLIEAGVINENCIELNKDIASAFAVYWNKFYDSKVPTVWIPFYHLKGESFWHFRAKEKDEKLKDFLSFGGTPSIGRMRSVIKCAYFDKALFNYLENDGCRAKLKEVLMANYITG